MWPCLAKFRHFGNILWIFGKWLRVYSVFVKYWTYFGKIGAVFQYCTWPNIEKSYSHLVTLLLGYRAQSLLSVLILSKKQLRPRSVYNNVESIHHTRHKPLHSIKVLHNDCWCNTSGTAFNYPWFKPPPQFQPFLLIVHGWKDENKEKRDRELSM